MSFDYKAFYDDLDSMPSLKFRVLPLGNTMTFLISSSLFNPVHTGQGHSF
jgi:hypothetical protein